MKGFTTAEAHANTEAKMWRKGKSTASSATLTNIRGRKQTRKHRKIVSIILVSRISSRRWADWAALRAVLMAEVLPLEAEMGPVEAVPEGVAFDPGSPLCFCVAFVCEVPLK